MKLSLALSSRPTSRRKRTALFLALTLGLGLWAGCKNPPTPTTTTISVGFNFDLGTAPNRLARTYAFFLGHTTNNYTLNLSLTGLSAANTLTVTSGSGATRQVFNSDAASVNTSTFPGNVAFLTFTSTGPVAPPAVRLNAVTLTTGIRAPEFVPAIADTVAAMPIAAGTAVTPNSPVELVFDGTKRFYFISVTGVANQTLDIVLDGPGKVLVNDTFRGFVMDDIDAQALDVVDGSAGGFKTFTTDGSRNTLLFTVILQGVPPTTSGVARFSVNRTTDAVPLKVRFNGQPSQFPIAAGAMAGALAPFVNRASQSLYQATEGRVRISSLTVYTSATAEPQTKPDAQILPITFPGGPFRVHAIPLTIIDLDLGWLANTTGDSGWVLAHELMHYRYLVPDEYRDQMPGGLDPSGPFVCPNSMMGVFGVEDLCWPGNHNPGGDPMLSTPPRNLSAWTVIAGRIGAPVPTMSPRRVLRPTSSVTFPLAVSVIGGPAPPTIPTPTLSPPPTPPTLSGPTPPGR